MVRGTAQQKRVGTREQRPEQSEKALEADTSPIFLNEGMRVAAGLINFAIFVATEWFVDVWLNLDKLQRHVERKIFLHPFSQGKSTSS